jgi:phosphate uptake regulator
MRAIIAKNMVDKAFTIHGSALQDYDGQDFDRIREEIIERDRELIRMSRKVIRQGLLRDARPPQGNGISRKSTYTEMSLIINEMNKRRNRLGIRELTQRAGQALLELKPCWMMSPLTVAQYLH